MAKVTELGHTSIETTLAVVGGKWKPLILWHLCDWGSKHEAYVARNGAQVLSKSPANSEPRRMVPAIG